MLGYLRSHFDGVFFRRLTDEAKMTVGYGLAQNSLAMAIFGLSRKRLVQRFIVSCTPIPMVTLIRNCVSVIGVTILRVVIRVTYFLVLVLRITEIVTIRGVVLIGGEKKMGVLL